MKLTTELPTDTLLAEYRSPLGEIMLASSGGILRGLWFEGQKYACAGIVSYKKADIDHESFSDIKKWLDAYFCGSAAAPSFPFEPAGTAFQKAVWAELALIPYGSTSTYREIAEKLGCKSPRAVGSAIGRNPISIVIPCHRVIGSGGSLTGYAGGIDRKARLLSIEQKID